MRVAAAAMVMGVRRRRWAVRSHARGDGFWWSSQWTLLFDTNVRGEPEKEGFAIGHRYNTAGRSFLLFALQADQ